MIFLYESIAKTLIYVLKRSGCAHDALEASYGRFRGGVVAELWWRARHIAVVVSNPAVADFCRFVRTSLIDVYALPPVCLVTVFSRRRSVECL